MNICVYGASSNAIDKSYIEKGEELGRIIAKGGDTVVYGGGAGGMMGAVARGARSENGDVIGVSPSFFKVDGSLYENCTEFIYTDTMRQRKEILETRSEGFIVTPGGVGTMDEFFEIFTLRQLDKHQKPIAIFNINGFYDELIEMLEHTIREKFMTPENRNLWFESDNPEEILDYIKTYVPKKIKLSELKDIK
ncbi:MAG: TIGR00730 family Rossman fold protein [Clostridia bacterium]|nr:TIGR00730 family Rossman fold protein [Clostridia bacterium]